MTSEQIPTRPVSTQEIMSTAAFARGLEEVRKGIVFDSRVDDDDWDYARGRLFGRIAPLNMPLRIGGRLNPAAIALFDAAWNRKLIV